MSPHFFLVFLNDIRLLVLKKGLNAFLLEK